MSEADGSSLSEAMNAISESGPLIQHLTNEVTMRETANVTLHWGGLPVMADAPAEAADMAVGADGVLINTGRATRKEVDTMIDAGEAANESGAATVLDPVGFGATPHRVESVTRLVDTVAFDAIKGNYGEIAGLAAEVAGEEAAADVEVKGVESVGDGGDPAAAARALAAETGAVIVASGSVDVVASGDRAVEIAVGDEQMGTFVGSGCMLGSTVAAFTAVGEQFSGAVHATAGFGMAGERATQTGDYGGPASYRASFMDEIAAVARGRPELPIEERITPL